MTMRYERWAVWALLMTIGTAGSSAQERAEARKPVQASPAETAARPDPPKRTQAELEAEFRRTLTKAVLKGSWRMTGDLAAKKPPGKPHDEEYSIKSVEKLAGDRWQINARIQFGDKDVTIPLVVRVVWAEDTPIITINELTMPLLGTYSARVMIYRNFYCGTWFGTNYGGVMSGEIVKEKQSDPPQPEPTGKEGVGGTQDRRAVQPSNRGQIPS